jgi:serine/threonine protein kinase
MCRGTHCRPDTRLCSVPNLPASLEPDNIPQSNGHPCDDDTASTVPLTPSPSSSVTPTSNAKRRAAFLARSLATRTISFVDSEVERLTRESKFLREEQPQADVARLDRSEFLVGNLLGEGGFSQVYEVDCVHLLGNDDDFAYNPQQSQARMALQESSDSGSARYVVKHLRPDLSSSPQRQQRSAFHAAAADLVLEAQYLARLNHPNIIRLRGWAAGGTSCFGKGSHDAYFLILDRLDETLSHRISTWRREAEALDMADHASIIHRYNEKLDFASQIALALEYLHERRIVYRDLKVDNVGFIHGNQVQLFDFGLCRELPPSKYGHGDKEQEKEFFHMSGVGTRRYCAPEVVLGDGYNLRVDVYSLSIVVYEMMSHHKPFGVIGPESHRILVAKGGQRPSIPHSWPQRLQRLLRSGWASEPCDRPNIQNFHQELQLLKDECNSQDKSNPRRPKMSSRIPNDWFVCSFDACTHWIRKLSGRDSCCSVTCKTYDLATHGSVDT